MNRIGNRLNRLETNHGKGGYVFCAKAHKNETIEEAMARYYTERPDEPRAENFILIDTGIRRGAYTSSALAVLAIFCTQIATICNKTV